MAGSAEVASLQALIDWKASLCTFTAEAKEALSSLAMEVQHTLAWLEEQLKYWTSMVRKCEEEVFQAKLELSRRKMMRIGDRPPDTTEQERALRRARERLEHAEEKVEYCRHWLRQLPEDISDYEGPARQLGAILEADMPKADALLGSKIASLEAYLQVAGGGP
ncbi:MAG: hypothetical protein FJ271_07830 [Planctomycetes bacterium]|nr:hypothetical protein [Planctomycetota bacterium]